MTPIPTILYVDCSLHLGIDRRRLDGLRRYAATRKWRVETLEHRDCSPAASVGMVWAHLARNAHGWRRHVIGWGGAVNAAGLCTIALVPFDVNGAGHNLGCYLAVGGGAAIVAATFRRRFSNIAWAVWFAVVVALFAIFLNVDAIPFSPFVTAAQKVLILSFAAWAGWLAWKVR